MEKASLDDSQEATEKPISAEPSNKENQTTPSVETTSQNQDLSQESVEETAEESVSAKTEDDTEHEEKRDDEVGKPQFETAPNVSMDEHQEDHTQVSDRIV